MWERVHVQQTYGRDSAEELNVVLEGLISSLTIGMH